MDTHTFEQYALQSENLADPVARSKIRNGVHLRSYQCEALRTIYNGAMRRNGHHFTVVFPRQSGKNETQAYLECNLMAANADNGGTIVKLIPTEKTQGQISRNRLEDVINEPVPEFGDKCITKKDRTLYRDTEVRYMSAQPGAAIVGATADLLLEVDEAQLVPPSKFDRDAAPMAASTNAVEVFWGTVWDDQTLLARESRGSVRLDVDSGVPHHFLTDAAAVGQEVPEYAEHVRNQVEQLGRDHPTIRTQYFCEEISDLTGMFTPERIEKMRGSHQPRFGPENDRLYVFLIDIAGSDEMSARTRREHGFSDRRDATVLTICEIGLPEDEQNWENGPIWKVVARRYYRNLPAAQLEERVSAEFERWKPRRAVLDHTGLGCLLSDYLNRRYPGICQAFDITAQVKTRMAWEFLAMVNTGRWQEYQCDELSAVPESTFEPGRDRIELLEDPALLQKMFFREVRACRMEPGVGGQQVRWGVPEGTRDPATGRMIHDDLVLSAALAVLTDRDLPIFTPPKTLLPPCIFDPMEF